MTVASSGPPQGTVRLALSIEANVALSRVVQHWTRDEANKLLSGDAEARQELIDQAVAIGLREGDCEVNYAEVWADGGKL
jgi:hypothetical protein